MNDTILLIISMAACLSGAVLKKVLSDKYESGNFVNHVYNAVVSFVSALCLLAVSSINTVSVFTVLLGLAFGLVTALQSIMFLKALEHGPFSYTSVIMSLSTIIPALSGAIFWQEVIAPVQYVGIALMMACFVLSVDTKGEKKKATAKWIIYSAIAFVCTGAIGVMQKLHQSSEYKMELDVFLVIAFSFSFVYSLVNIFILKDKRQTKSEKPSVLTLLPIILMVVSGIAVAANNKLNLYLSGVMDSAVFFPIVNGGHLVLTTISALLFFKEKLTAKQWVGMILGIVAVVLLCNPF
ncbi:MAG: EamA family transporter [Clostridia bacterium]|nr:EamA family transporter [Clostridia bacterium]